MTNTAGITVIGDNATTNPSVTSPVNTEPQLPCMGEIMTDVDLSGQTLTEVRVVFTAALGFTGDFVVLLISPFSLETSSRADLLSPDTDPVEAFAPLHELVGKRVSASHISDTGTLSLTFDDGTASSPRRTRPMSPGTSADRTGCSSSAYPAMG